MSLDTYIHHQFMMITNNFLDQDSSGSKLVEILNGTKMVKTYNPYLDASSDGEQDSSNEDEEEGFSLQLFTLPCNEETVKDHWEDHELDDQHDSHMYDNYRH